MSKYFPDELKKKFIVEDMGQYWMDKKRNAAELIETFIKMGVTVAVHNGKVVELHCKKELHKKTKEQIARVTEEFLYAEKQHDALVGFDETGGKD